MKISDAEFSQALAALRGPEKTAKSNEVYNRAAEKVRRVYEREAAKEAARVEREDARRVRARERLEKLYQLIYREGRAARDAYEQREIDRHVMRERRKADKAKESKP